MFFTSGVFNSSFFRVLITNKYLIVGEGKVDRPVVHITDSWIFPNLMYVAEGGGFVCVCLK